jgi:hypothetical protein
VTTIATRLKRSPRVLQVNFSATLFAPGFALVLDEAVVPLLVVITVPVALVLVTVTGILDPLVAGNWLKVTHGVPDAAGHTSTLSRSLSKGPVGPDSYFHVKFRPSKFTCRGSESGYCSSPQRPRKESQEVGVDVSEGINVISSGDVELEPEVEL